jgi:hypothetical protein
MDTMTLPRKPGPGWKRLGPSVWEHSTGIRIHGLGAVRMPTGAFIFGDNHPWSRGYDLACRTQGRKTRGIMVWALAMLASGGKP